MSNYKKSNYAINKMCKGIVYRNADGSILEVTFEKIAANEPDFTKEDFEKLKQLSDELYHEEAKNDWTYHYHIASNLDDNRNSLWQSALTPEELILKSDKEKCVKETVKKAIDTLTEKQKRRFLMYFIKGQTYREIAKSEGTSAMSVCESIRSAQKKIKKFLGNTLTNGLKNHIK